MVDETMFARLEHALAREETRQFRHNISDRAAIVRALLAELRKIAGEMPDGFVTTPAVVTAKQAYEIREAFRKLYTQPVPKVEIAATDQTTVKAGAVGFIDAILAEAGGSGG